MVNQLQASDLERVFRALAFAADKHRDQRRKDEEASPYINHPIALARILVEVGHVVDVETLCAAILHDTIEDTDTTADELEQHFGKTISDIVQEVTDDGTLRKAERKHAQVVHAPHKSYKAKLVKLADKISNLTDISRSHPVGWTHERVVEYFDWAHAVVDGLRGVNPALEEEFDRVHAQRP